ncbi:MAG: small basic protein [Chlamydiae bacterium]|nr:small basic protein [Chlamydiota bacterium]
MSRHPSYGKSGKAAAKRNVLKRFERIDIMKALGRFEVGKDKKVTGLPKTLVTK